VAAAVYGQSQLEQLGLHLKYGVVVAQADIAAAANRVLAVEPVHTQLNQYVHLH
jgi:hypothetical protein